MPLYIMVCKRKPQRDSRSAPSRELTMRKRRYRLVTAMVGLDGLIYTATVKIMISPTISPSSTDSFLTLRLEDVAALAEVNLLLVLALSLLASLVL